MYLTFEVSLVGWLTTVCELRIWLAFYLVISNHARAVTKHRWERLPSTARAWIQTRASRLTSWSPGAPTAVQKALLTLVRTSHIFTLSVPLATAQNPAKKLSRIVTRHTRKSEKFIKYSRICILQNGYNVNKHKNQRTEGDPIGTWGFDVLKNTRMLTGQVKQIHRHLKCQKQTNINHRHFISGCICNGTQVLTYWPCSNLKSVPVSWPRTES